MTGDSASLIVEAAADAIRSDPAGFGSVLDDIPVPLYVADAEGTVTYFNQACIPLAGRTPEVGRDKWCVTWRMFTTDGANLPHEECPMAVAIREKRPVRDAEAIALRPDGTRIHYVPYPTPVFDGDGNFAGAVNLLLDVTAHRTPADLRKQAQRCRKLAVACRDITQARTLELLADKYEDLSARCASDPTSPEQAH